MFTIKESKVLRLLMSSTSYYSINDIARECNLSPNGAYKILKKLEKDDIIYCKDIGRIKAYRINFENTLILSYMEIALNDKRINEAKIKVRVKDLSEMKGICKAVALFGSYVTEKKNPSDIDILFVFEPEKFRLFQKKLDEILGLIPYKIHDVIQTEQDFVNNLKKQDKIIREVIRNGVILFGHDVIARSVKSVQS